MSIRKSVIKIKGRPASPGVGIGKVKIVSTLQDFRSFESGDILVTEMTHPNMVIIMLKAAAIVTDIGGLTCHAAILSRELGIPCVVATKLAKIRGFSWKKIKQNNPL